MALEGPYGLYKALNGLPDLLQATQSYAVTDTSRVLLDATAKQASKSLPGSDHGPPWEADNPSLERSA